MPSSAQPVALSEEQVGNKTFQITSTVIHATPDQVWKVLTDYDNAKRIFSNVRKCEVVKEHDGIKDVHFVVEVAGVWTFEYVLGLKEEYPGKIEWTRVSGAFKENDGYWKLEPVEDGHATKVTCAKWMDGGLFPQALIKMQIRETMPVVMKNLQAGVDRLSLAQAAKSAEAATAEATSSVVPNP